MKQLIVTMDASLMSRDKIAENAVLYANFGADGICITDLTPDEKAREELYSIVRAVSKTVDVPLLIGCFVRRFEDIKKAFYTGASKVLISERDASEGAAFSEGADRFGRDNLFVISEDSIENGKYVKLTSLKDIPVTEETLGFFVDTDMFGELSESESVNPVLSVKKSLKAAGMDVNTFESLVSFDELKKNSDGLVPCIVQDYADGTVLMMAYMDREAYDRTVATGVMTYHSRSRNELWVKGLTSGHFQYLKELSVDCDSDTLLAKVSQVGAACHTGNRSCFYTTAVKHEYEDKNASQVLNALYAVIEDRKVHPKEGSYTNYLFNKGIDKILKKCGEEATEMVIAAKNPDAEELKYEIADLLYHMSVLMVECGVDWNDVMSELANR